MAERIRSRHGSGNDKVLGVKPETNPVIGLKTCRIQIKLGVSGDAAEIQNLRFHFFGRNSGALLGERILNRSLTVVKAQVGEIRTRVVPDLLVDDEKVLPVGMLNVNLAQVAEIGNGRLRRDRNGKGQKQDEQ